MGIVQYEQELIWNRFGLLVQVLDHRLDQSSPLSEHLRVPLLLQSDDLMDPRQGLSMALEIESMIKMEFDQCLQRHLDAEVISHPQDPAEHHPQQIPRFRIRWHEAIGHHMRHSVEMIRDRIDARERTHDPLEGRRVDRRTTRFQSFDQMILHRTCIGPRFDVHDAHQT